jgi:hypothetical protein
MKEADLDLPAVIAEGKSLRYGENRDDPLQSLSQMADAIIER